MKKSNGLSIGIVLCMVVFILAACGGGGATAVPSVPTAADEEGVVSITLGAVTGENPLYAYIGIGGASDGVLNPTIRAKVGDTVRITFINTDETAHNLLIDAYNINMGPLQNKNDSAEVEFVVDQPGEFEYYCNIESHNTLGMVGKLIVEGEAPAEATDAADATAEATEGS